MKFSEWFDIDNITHAKAYLKLIEDGAWPSGFVPEGLEMDSLWHVNIAAKMAEAYAKEKSKHYILKHFKGGEYERTSAATLSSAHDIHLKAGNVLTLTIYKAKSDGEVWARPSNEMYEEVAIAPPPTGPRFKVIP
jgi:hypothetical protein